MGLHAYGNTHLLVELIRDLAAPNEVAVPIYRSMAQVCCLHDHSPHKPLIFFFLEEVEFWAVSPKLRTDEAYNLVRCRTTIRGGYERTRFSSFSLPTLTTMAETGKPLGRRILYSKRGSAGSTEGRAHQLNKLWEPSHDCMTEHALKAFSCCLPQPYPLHTACPANTQRSVQVRTHIHLDTPALS